MAKRYRAQDVLSQRLRDEWRDSLYAPLPQQWVEFIHYLNEREQQHSLWSRQRGSPDPRHLPTSMHSFGPREPLINPANLAQWCH